jgi:putative nucleotidyltransferase with HDIG domain
MSEWLRENRIAVHLGILGLTIIFVSAVLLVGYQGQSEAPPRLAIGEPSPERFIADRSTSEIPDPEKTEQARTLAENNVPAPYEIDNQSSQSVINVINAFYADLADGAFGEIPEPETVSVPDLGGLDLTGAETALDDVGLIAYVAGSVASADEALLGTVATQTPTQGTTVDVGSTVSLLLYTTGDSPTTSLLPPTTTTVPPVGTAPRIDIADQIAALMENHAVVGQDIVTDFVLLHEKDIDRVAAGERSVFPDMQMTSIEWAQDELTAGIKDTELNAVQQRFLNPATRPPMAIAGIPEDDVDTTHTAIATLVARRLQANERIDQPQWELDKQAARQAVPDQTTSYSFGDQIADQGEILTSVQVAAIQELGLYEPEVVVVAPGWALALFGAMSILVFAFLMYRINSKHLERTRDVVLLAIILCLAALAAKVPDIVTSPGNHSVGYIIPAVAIGVMASILFDQRTALLMAMPMAGLTAIATTDIPFTLYAGVAAAIPVAFVSSLSSRSQLRLSVVGSAAVVAPVAAGLEFLFEYGVEGASPLLAAFWAFSGAIVFGFLGQGLVSFLETAFGVTTTMSLLDLLDRNHPALQELEEKAPGTFNHSMLVGSLAGRAARSVGADPLLAQAAAWYHDLGKTTQPQYFVENQLGYNPHDELDPVESAEIIRRHVEDGLDLAKQFRIPDDVADGIRMHHGTSLMRYFYHKALSQDHDVDPELFRHHGVKPRGKELAIVMISDASEAAARAYAQQEQPTEEGLRKLVDDIVSEKLDDGQFDEASLTFGELTTIKREVVSGLASYYHARVEYPDFPTSEGQRVE